MTNENRTNEKTGNVNYTRPDAETGSPEIGEPGTSKKDQGQQDNQDPMKKKNPSEVITHPAQPRNEGK